MDSFYAVIGKTFYRFLEIILNLLEVERLSGLLNIIVINHGNLSVLIYYLILDLFLGNFDSFNFILFNLKNIHQIVFFVFLRRFLLLLIFI